jgi:hypothetical protein
MFQRKKILKLTSFNSAEMTNFATAKKHRKHTVILQNQNTKLTLLNY